MSVFRLAHLSDAHLGPLPELPWRDLANKRITGLLNWRRTRRDHYDMAILAKLVADIHASHPDHVAMTGDLANIGHPLEFPLARHFLETLGPPDQVSFVPGNHDVYVKDSLGPLLQALGLWMTGTPAEKAAPSLQWPYLRRIGDIALIGLNSAVPTLPFLASGLLRKAQIAAAGHLLQALGKEGACRVVMIHHPPHQNGAKAGRALSDAPAFEAMLKQAGAELILHGHNHRASLTYREGPQGPVPIVGVASASLKPEGETQGGSWHLFTLARHEQGWHIDIEQRHLSRRGCFETGWHQALDQTGSLHRILS
jgi:3',5'-cyclic AMP phosphodiesterase CpdA